MRATNTGDLNDLRGPLIRPRRHGLNRDHPGQCDAGDGTPYTGTLDIQHDQGVGTGLDPGNGLHAADRHARLGSDTFDVKARSPGLDDDQRRERNERLTLATLTGVVVVKRRRRRRPATIRSTVAGSMGGDRQRRRQETDWVDVVAMLGT